MCLFPFYPYPGFHSEHTFKNFFSQFHGIIFIDKRNLTHDFIKRNPSVVYTIMKYYGSLEDFRSRNNCHGKWESVIAYGDARYIEDEQELQELLNNKFLKYYGKDKREIPRSSLMETRAIVMEVTKMTGRRELEEKQTEFYKWEK